jgi:hypothetical protein
MPPFQEESAKGDRRLVTIIDRRTVYATKTIILCDYQRLISDSVPLIFGIGSQF